MSSYSVPFSSQYTDLGHHEWRARGCGITALKMVMDFWHGQNPTHQTTPLDDLLKVGLETSAYREGIGWTHRGLVALAGCYGYDSFNADWAANGPTPKDAGDAWGSLAVELERGPVLASVHAGMDSNRGGGHIVLITGFQDGLVLLNDPEQMNEREGRRALALAAFLNAFKRRYIIVRPPVNG